MPIPVAAKAAAPDLGGESQRSRHIQPEERGEFLIRRESKSPNAIRLSTACLTAWNICERR